MRATLLFSLAILAGPCWAASLPTPRIACNSTADDTTCDDQTDSSTTINKPTHTVAGDLMTAYCYTNGSALNSLSGGATWNVYDSETTFGPFREKTFQKVAADAEPSTYTLSVTGGSSHGCLITDWRSIAQTSPLDVSTNNTGTGTTATCGSITTSNANALVICQCMAANSANTFTAPSGYTEEHDIFALFTSWKMYASAGATGDVTATISASDTWTCKHAAFHYNTAGARIYLPSTGAPAVSPTFGSVWEDNDQGDRIAAVFTRGSTAMTNHVSNEEAADTTSKDHLNRQYAIQIGAQTISGVVQCNLRALESAAAANAVPGLYIQLADSTGVPTSEVLLDSTNAGNSTNEYPTTTAAARNFPARARAHTLTSQTAANNDYLIVEFGAYYNNTSSTARTDTLRFGDTAATELDRDDAETTDNHPWCDFLGGLAAPSAAACGPRMALLGVGCK